MKNEPKYITKEEILSIFKKPCPVCGAEAQLKDENNELFFRCERCSKIGCSEKYIPGLKIIKKVNKEMIEMSVFNYHVEEGYMRMQESSMQRGYLSDKYDMYLGDDNYDAIVDSLE